MTPTTLPPASTTAPPESPGTMAASSWISPLSRWGEPSLSSCTVICWSSARTVPGTALGVPPTPPALPTATTSSPTFTVDEEPSGATVRPDAPFSRRTVASYVCPLPTSVARTEVAPATTWWLVSTRPSADSTIPVPAPCAPSYPMVVLTSTRPLDTAAAAEACSGVSAAGCCAPPGGDPGTTPGGALGAVLGGAVGLGTVGLGRAGELGAEGSAVAEGFGGAGE